MHDIVNINPTTFEYKKRATSKSKDSKESTQVDVTSVNSISPDSENVNTEIIKSYNRDSEYLELAKNPANYVYSRQERYGKMQFSFGEKQRTEKRDIQTRQKVMVYVKI